MVSLFGYQSSSVQPPPHITRLEWPQLWWIRQTIQWRLFVSERPWWFVRLIHHSNTIERPPWCALNETHTTDRRRFVYFWWRFLDGKPKTHMQLICFALLHQLYTQHDHSGVLSSGHIINRRKCIVWLMVLHEKRFVFGHCKYFSSSFWRSALCVCVCVLCRGGRATERWN